MIIVTGGAGFIGSALVWGLNVRGEDDILVVDELDESEKWKNLRGLRYADYMEKGEFLWRVEQEGLDEGVTAVLHMGACSDTTERNAAYLMENNTRYTRVLAEACAGTGVRLVYASSAATYGDGLRGYEDDESALETLRPMNMYGYSKQAFDAWAGRTGLLTKVAGVKFSNVFGPNEWHKGRMRSMVVQAWEQIRTRGTVRLFKSYKKEYGDGGQKRDFVYVKDTVAMVLWLMEHEKVCGIFNAGAGVARTWNDLAGAVFAAMGKEAKIEYIEMPEDLRGQYQYFTELPMGKLQAAGYERATTGLEEAVRDYVQEYLETGESLDAMEAGRIGI